MVLQILYDSGKSTCYNIDAFGLTFYPDVDYELYYVDPSDRDKYIALDEYFNYLKVARVWFGAKKTKWK